MVMMTTSLADAKANLSAYVSQVERERARVTITKKGRPAAVVLSVDDLESLEETISVLGSSDTMAALVEARRDISANRLTSAEDMSALVAARRG